MAVLEQSRSAAMVLDVLEANSDAKKAVASQMRSAEYGVQSDKSATSGVKYKIGTTTKNNKVVMLEEDIFEGKTGKPHNIIADYIAENIGKHYKIIESGQSVYIGEDLPKEFTQSKYTTEFLKKRKKLKNAKDQSIQNLGEIIEIATDRKWEKSTKEKHKTDAKYGFYKYTSRVALPKFDSEKNVVGSHLYEIELVIRNDADGRKYLYDIQNIVKIKEGDEQVSSTWNSKPDSKSSSPSKNRVSQNEGSVNTQSMQEGELYSPGKRVTISKEEKRIGNIIQNEESRLFQENNAKGYNVIERMARDLRKPVKFVRGLTNGQGEMYDGILTDDGIFINVEAENPTRFAATHEFSHRVKQLAPEAWARYQRYVISELKNETDAETGKSKYELAYEKKEGHYETELIDEEIACDRIGQIFSDVDELAKFIWDNRGFAARIRDWWYDTLVKLKMIQEKRDAKELWARAYRKAMGKAKKGEPGEEKMLYAGNRAKTANRSLWRQAKKMQKNGATKEDILKETGWFVGRDGKWRYEINDKYSVFNKQGAFNESNERILPPGIGVLEEVFEHKKLYEAYPELRYRLVVFSKNLDADTRGGVTEDGVIILNANRPDKLMKATLIHEIQHLIQNIESFSKGTTGEVLEKKDAQGIIIKEIQQRRDEILKSLSEEDRKLYDEYYKFQEELNFYPLAYDVENGDIEEYLQKEKVLFDIEGRMKGKELAKKIKKYIQWLAHPDWYYETLYYNTAGEVEARDAASRIDMADNERKSKFPYLGNHMTIFSEDIFGENSISSSTADKAFFDKDNKNAYDAVTDKFNDNKVGEYSGEKAFDNNNVKRYNGVKYNRYEKKWIPDLTKSELDTSMKTIKRDVLYSGKTIVDTANWLMTRVNGKNVFAIYSTESAADPTLLYESKGGQAEFERDTLLNILEVIENGESIDGKSGIISRLLSGDWVQKKRSLGNSDGTLARERGNRDVAILQGKSSPKPTAAFRNVIKNLLEIQGRDRDRNGNRYSVTGTRLAEADVEETEKTTSGFIPPGAEPRCDVKVPKSVQKGTKVRQFPRTAAEAETLSDETAEGVLENVEKGKFNYTPLSDKSAIKNAYATIDVMGVEWVEKKVFHFGHSPQDWALSKNNKKALS